MDEWVGALQVRFFNLGPLKRRSNLLSATLDPNTSAKAFEQTVSALRQTAAAAASTQAERIEKALQTATSFPFFNQDVFAALNQYTRILAAGSQGLFRLWTTSGQLAFEQALSGLYALMAAKTARERMDVQIGLASAPATRAMTEGTRVAQAGVDLVAQVSAPLTVASAPTGDGEAAGKKASP